MTNALLYLCVLRPQGYHVVRLCVPCVHQFPSQDPRHATVLLKHPPQNDAYPRRLIARRKRKKKKKKVASQILALPCPFNLCQRQPCVVLPSIVIAAWSSAWLDVLPKPLPEARLFSYHSFRLAWLAAFTCVQVQPRGSSNMVTTVAIVRRYPGRGRVGW